MERYIGNALDIGYLFAISLALYHCFNCLRKSKGKSRLIYALTLFFVLVFSVEVYAKVISSNQRTLNALYDLYLPVFAILVILIFNFSYRVISVRRFHVFVSLFFLLVYVYFIFAFEKNNGILPILIASTIICLSSLLVFISLILQPMSRQLEKTFIFWFGIAWLIWSTFSIFRFGGSYFIYENNAEISRIFRLLLDLVNLVTYSILAYSLTCLKYQEK